MFVVYGKRRFKLKEEEITPYKCPRCSHNFSTKLVSYTRYFHIFWIPFWPFDKETVAVCTECELSRDEMKYGPELVSQSREIKKGLKHPVYAYAGLFLIGGLITTLVYGNITTQNRFERYAHSPRIGDIYTIRNEADYIFFRILQLKNDSIQIQESKFIYSDWSSINAAQKNVDSVYQPGSYYIKQAELVRFFQEDKVNGIERKGK